MRASEELLSLSKSSRYSSQMFPLPQVFLFNPSCSPFHCTLDREAFGVQRRVLGGVAQLLQFFSPFQTGASTSPLTQPILLAVEWSVSECKALVIQRCLLRRSVAGFFGAMCCALVLHVRRPVQGDLADEIDALRRESLVLLAMLALDVDLRIGGSAAIRLSCDGDSG